MTRGEVQAAVPLFIAHHVTATTAQFMQLLLATPGEQSECLILVDANLDQTTLTGVRGFGVDTVVLN